MWNTKIWIDYTTPMSFDFTVDFVKPRQLICTKSEPCTWTWLSFRTTTRTSVRTFVLLLWTFLRKEKGINTKKKLILKTCIRWLSLLYTNLKVGQMSYVSFAWWVKLTSVGYYKPLPSPSTLYGMLFKTDFWQKSLIPRAKSYGSVPADPPMWWFGYSSVLWPRSCCEFQFVVGSPAVHPCFGCMTSFCSSQTLAVVLLV